MTALARLRRRSAAERRLLLQAVLLYGIVSVLLRLVRYGRLVEWGSRLCRPRSGRSAPPDRVAWAVDTAAIAAPRLGTCLSRALTAHWLLARAGQPSTIQFGVARHDSALAAHAWLEIDGRIVVGAAESPSGYAPLRRDACCS